jgi:DNA-binding transcriptional ArsR family regulator
MDAVFRALADPGRRVLLDALFEQPGQTQGELADRLDVSRQAVSKHLAVLEAAGLVVARFAGREKHHWLNPVPLVEIHQRWVSKFAARKAAMLLALRRELEEKPR